MIVTKIEPGKNRRYRVYGDDEFLFSLYKGELRRYHIEENCELSVQQIEEISKEIILKRGKERALYLLERCPLPTAVVREKLRSNEYPEKIIDEVISFLEEYHYLDDSEYIRMYVATYQNSKSKRQMIRSMQQKGISKSLILTYFDREEFSEGESFRRQFQKYINGKDPLDWKTRQKVFRYFYSKGYEPALIEEGIRQWTKMDY